MKALRLTLFALAAAALTASAQRVEQIPVTQAGLVPEGGFGSAPPVHKSPSDAKDAQGLVPAAPVAQAPPATPNFDLAESTLDIDQSLVPRAPPQVLSEYVVRDSNAPTFRLRDIHTKPGLEDLSLREHPGLHVGNILNLNAEAGYGMFLDDEQLENLEDYRDTALAMKVGGDPAEADAIVNAANTAFLLDRYIPNPPIGISGAPQPRSGTLLMNFEELRLTWVEHRF